MDRRVLTGLVGAALIASAFAGFGVAQATAEDAVLVCAAKNGTLHVADGGACKSGEQQLDLRGAQGPQGEQGPPGEPGAEGPVWDGLANAEYIIQGAFVEPGIETIVALCPDGSYVLSGGHQGTVSVIESSRPHVDLVTGTIRGWEITVVNNTTEDALWNAFAYCVPSE